MSVELRALVGTNPLGLFAALGTLAAVDRQAPGLGNRLRWSEGVVPRAWLDGPKDLDHVLDLVNSDREGWITSPILYSGPAGEPMDDIKPEREEIRQWAALVQASAQPSDRRDVDQFGALMAEDALALKSNAKPTHFHFSAGNQKFLGGARELAEKVGRDELTEALVGPWEYKSKLLVLGWDARPERIYALRGSNPSGDKKLGVPGADWLGFVGLSFFPVVRSGLPYGDPLLTTGCDGSWNKGSFQWPLWSVPLSGAVIKSLLGYSGLEHETAELRAQRGVFRLLEVPIRRSDQGAYGSFGPAADVMPQRHGPGRQRPRKRK